MASPNAWNPDLYQSGHSFVWQFGKDLLTLLDPRPGERILDLGCGTGQLTAEIARSGAEVTGVDSSAGMVAEARRNYPDLRFQIGDATALGFDAGFDAVFSNAVLHWVRDAPAVARGVRNALKPGGRFVAEFGGRGNVARLMEAACAALRRHGVADPEGLNPWYFPSVGEYATVIESHGLAVSSAALFDRTTPLDGPLGLRHWIEMFGSAFLSTLDPSTRESFFDEFERLAAPALLRDGVWHADYRRLRIVAVRLEKS